MTPKPVIKKVQVVLRSAGNDLGTALLHIRGRDFIPRKATFSIVFRGGTYAVDVYLVRARTNVLASFDFPIGLLDAITSVEELEITVTNPGVGGEPDESDTMIDDVEIPDPAEFEWEVSF